MINDCSPKPESPEAESPEAESPEAESLEPESNELTVEDIQPYISVGPNSTLSVTVNKSTFDMGFMLALIVGSIVLLILIIYAIWYTREVSTFKTDPPPIIDLNPIDTRQTNVGASISPRHDVQGWYLVTPELTKCESLGGDIVNNRCYCPPGFYGKECDLEKHDARFIAVGTPHDDTIEVSVLEQYYTEKKSFDNNSCSDRCLKNPQCIGFVYPEKHMCTLLTNEVKVYAGEMIPYNWQKEASLYVRDSRNVIFEGKYYLAEHNNSVKYWLRDIEGTIGNVIKIDFYPRHVSVEQGKKGIYSLVPFDSKHLNILWNKGNTSQVICHIAGTKLMLPEYWKYSLPLYVCYF